ncbi:MAG: terminase family protein [Actinomycetota bacterium]|nr:terminase family protein [Actinomycetota bacterium]
MASKGKAPKAVATVLRPYQRRWINDKSLLKIWLASRQIGKSFTLSLEAVIEALETKCDNMILSSSERQSKEVMRKVFSHLRVLQVVSDNIIQAENATKEEVELPNGSRIISLPANPDTARGFSGNIFLDEFAFQRDSSEIWKAMYPTVTGGFKVRISSTTKGKSNMFYRLWTEGDLSKHMTDIYTAVREGLKADVDALRKNIGDPDAWAQEYECQFLDETTAYLTYELIIACENEKATADPGDLAGGEFYLGVDIGRKADRTILWLWERVGDVFWTRMVKEMRNAPFAAQRDFLDSLLDSSSSIPIRRCCIDATGIGAQLAEEAALSFGPMVEPVVFTGKVKEDLAVTMRRKFEDRQVRIPADRDIREDFHTVKRFITSAGNIRFDAERTELGHADRFWAAALGIHAASGPVPLIEFEATRRGRRFNEMGAFALGSTARGMRGY